MKQPTEEVLSRVDGLIEKGQAVLRTHRPTSANAIKFSTLDPAAFNEWRSQVVSALRSSAGADSSYAREFDNKVTNGQRDVVKAGLGILQAFRDDCEHGYLDRTAQMARAGIYSDFLRIAERLVDSGCQDGAASVCGAVLESGLWKMAEQNGIRISPSDDIAAVNRKLTEANVYAKLVGEQLRVWITLKSNADQGRVDEYNASDVKAMIDGVNSFLGNP